MNTLRRYLRTVLRFWGASLAADMEYRLNFTVATLAALTSLVGSVFTLSLFFRAGDGATLGGWTWAQALIVMGIYTLVAGIQSAVMTPNRMRVTEYVREGTLDFVLLKPIDSQFWLSTHKFSLFGLPNVVFGLGLIAYAAAHVDPPLSLGGVLLGLPLVALGVLVLYGIGFMLCTLTIWFVKMWNITIAMQELVEAGKYPLSAYPLGYQVFFTFVLPVAFITTVPAEHMLGRGTAGWWLAAAGVTLVVLLIARAFWQFALRSYTSASS